MRLSGICVYKHEATAFADPENEHQIQKAFEALIKNKTVLMIAHRLSTVQDADHIIVLSGGKISEQGCHESLLAQHGVYAAMWEDYQRSARWKVGNPAGEYHKARQAVHRNGKGEKTL